MYIYKTARRDDKPFCDFVRLMIKVRLGGGGGGGGGILYIKSARLVYDIVCPSFIPGIAIKKQIVVCR